MRADGSIPDDAVSPSVAQRRAAGIDIENLVKTTTIVCNEADKVEVEAIVIA